MLKIAVFASGSGTNAENLIKYFTGNKHMQVQLILSNNKDAGVLERAKMLGIQSDVFSKKQFVEGTDVLKCLEDNKIDLIVLAGFLLLVPLNIIERFHDRIINIHPALLPSHGGKGFYGNNVHQAVIDSKAIMSGITIHKVNDRFDEGEIIFQAACHVAKDETAASLAMKIHELEYAYFPVVAEKYFLSLN